MPDRGPPPRVADPGLQSERTYLAWQRTGLAFAAAGALLVHAAVRTHFLLAYLPGVFGLAVAAFILLRALLRYRSIEAAARGSRDAASPRLAAALAAAAALLGVTGLIVVLAG
jgi:uncharacterized membrane protein YidH (DUF202 family)